MECPKCGRDVEDGAFICPSCEFILDTSFLGDDITDEEQHRRANARKKGVRGSGAYGEDAMILGDALQTGVQESFASVDAGVSVREVTHTRFYIGGSVAQVLDPDAVLEVPPHALDKKPKLTPFEEHVLELVNGKRSVARIQKKAPMEAADCKAALAMLAEKGVVRLRGFKRKKEAAPSSSPLPPRSDSIRADAAFPDAETSLGLPRAGKRQSASGVHPAPPEAETRALQRPPSGRSSGRVPVPVSAVAMAAALEDTGGFISPGALRRSAEELLAEEVPEGGDVFAQAPASTPPEPGLIDAARALGAPRVVHREVTAARQGVDDIADLPTGPLPESAPIEEDERWATGASDVDEHPVQSLDFVPEDDLEPEDPAEATPAWLPVPSQARPAPASPVMAAVPLPAASSSATATAAAEQARELNPVQPNPNTAHPIPLPASAVALPGQALAPAAGSGLRVERSRLAGLSITPREVSIPATSAPSTLEARAIGVSELSSLGGSGLPRPSATSTLAFERRTKAEKIYDQALKDRAAGRLSSARMNAKLAVNFDSSVAAYRVLLHELEREDSEQPTRASKDLTLFEQAGAAEGRGEYEEAVRLLEEAIGLAPETASLRNRLGVVLAVRLKRYEEALEQLKRAVELEPHSVVFMNNFSKVTGMLESVRDRMSVDGTHKKKKKSEASEKKINVKLRPRTV